MHVAAGGSLPRVPSLVAFAAIVAGVCWLASGARWSGPRLLAALAAAQAGFHLSFMALTTPAMDGAAGMSLSASAPGAAMAGMHGGCAMSWSMLAAHAVAAVVSALLLSRGEALLWSVLVAVGAAGVPVTASPRSAASHPRAVPRWHQHQPSIRQWVAGAVSRRGPPFAVLA